MSEGDELLSIGERALRAASAAGAEAAEAFVLRTRETSIDLVGEYAAPKELAQEGVGLRVLAGGRLGLSGTQSVTDAALADVARHAVAAARRAPTASPLKGFRSAAPLRAPSRIHPALRDVDAARLAALIDAASQRLAAAKDVTYSGLVAQVHVHAFAVANTEGVRAWDATARERFTVEARVARGAEERTAQDGATARAPVAESHDCAAIVDATVARARAALNASPLATAVHEAILAPLAASQVVALFTPALSAKRVAARQSPLAGLEQGAEVAGPLVTMRDAPEGPLGVHRLRVDHEGTPTANAPLVERGRLASLLYDTETATAEGRAPTGHAMRGGVSGSVAVRPLNLQVDAGEASLDDLIAGATRAVLVNESLMGGFVANDVTGDFSLVAPFAFLVENGRVTQALPPTTVAGNAHRALRAVRALSRERRELANGTFPAIHLGGVSCAT